MTHTSFKAIADPTRREILTLLAGSESPLPITTITEQFETSRQAVTKHIKVLRAAGLIAIRKQGRERYCSVNLIPLKEVFDWVARYKDMWSAEQTDDQSDLHLAHKPQDSGEESENDLSARRLALYRAVSSM